MGLTYNKNGKFRGLLSECVSIWSKIVIKKYIRIQARRGEEYSLAYHPPYRIMLRSYTLIVSYLTLSIDPPIVMYEYCVILYTENKVKTKKQKYQNFLWKFALFFLFLLLFRSTDFIYNFLFFFFFLLDLLQTFVPQCQFDAISYIYNRRYCIFA